MAATENFLQNRRGDNHKNLIPSSSPAFGTPVHPVIPRKDNPIPAPPALKPTILPIVIPPATLRPVAVRIFTRSHNLNLKSSALASLASFIGRHVGAGWKSDGLGEKVLEEIARSWKRLGGPVIVDGDGEMLKSILKSLEGCMVGGRIAQGKSGASSLSREGSFKFGAQRSENQDGLSRTPTLLQRDSSFGISRLEVADIEEEEDLIKDPREWITVIGAFDQPRLTYHVGKKHFERSTTKPSLFPPPSHKTELFRQRYHIVHQRVLRNEAFQERSLPASRTSSRNATKITPISNLLGRSGTTHLLLGLLTISPTGTLTLSDLTGSITLDLQHARPIPEGTSWFAPGMIVLIDGSYEEDYTNPTAGSSAALGNTGGIGGTIGGKFMAFSVGHPPVERRNLSLGVHDSSNPSEAHAGTAFGWTDFLGLGSERATGARMRRLCQRLLNQPQPQADPDDPIPSKRSSVIAIASEVNLFQPSTLTALRTLLSTYSSSNPADVPLAIVLMGNFAGHAALSGAPGTGSIEYKEAFDALASVLSDFPNVIARTTLVFAPGDNDAWPSAFAAGAATPLPRKAVPDIFTNRIRRVIAEANREVHGVGAAKKGGKEGEAIWTTNPARLSWFGVAGEMVLFRDDTLGRLRRTALKFNKPRHENEVDTNGDAIMTGAETIRDATEASTTQQIASGLPLPSSPPVKGTQQMDLDGTYPSDNGPTDTAETGKTEIDPHIQTARSLAFTMLSQSHLSPFPVSIRPQQWSYASSLSLYPLPSVLVLADSEAPPYVLSYAGCAVVNPSSIVRREQRRERGARWVEWDISNSTGNVREKG